MTRQTHFWTHITILALAGAVLLGCGRAKEGPFSPLYLDSPREPVTRQGPPVIDPPAPPIYNTFHRDLLRPNDELAENAPSWEVADAARRAIDSLRGFWGSNDRDPEALSNPLEEAVTVSGSSGQYLTLGAVVLEVYGQPIYADQVLSAVAPALRAEAGQLDRDTFRRVALELIWNQVMELRQDELEFAAAERELSFDDRRLARHLAMEWRKEQIRQADGSLEQARRRAAEAGEDFDELVAQRERRIIIEIFYQRRILPRIQVSAEDMRRYYRANRESRFTEHARARFRLIEIDPRSMGGRQEAIELIEHLHERASGGEDFEAIARATNHDSSLARTGGDVGWIDREAFYLPDVEEAVWEIQPGEVTGIIDTQGKFYIAKLEERKPGRVRRFEEQAVQAEIHSALEAIQHHRLREAYLEPLIDPASIRENPGMMQMMHEMAMQRYDLWAAEGDALGSRQ